MTEITSAYKVAYHQKKLRAYVKGEDIYPASLELDITSACNKECRDCPSARGRRTDRLSMDTVRRLFSLLEGRTRGLLMTGGEPTLSPDFPEVLRLARAHGFEDVAVVTNGAFLADEPVANALLAHASTIRVSLYGWGNGSCAGLYPTLDHIESLRERIEKTRSKLQIGVSALTSAANADTLKQLVHDAASSGAHWIYFHPTCRGWDVGAPRQVDQRGVLDNVLGLQNGSLSALKVFISPDRYSRTPLQFSGYHAAHFLLVVGADGMNYLAPEVKYQPQHVLASGASEWNEGFLWEQKRLDRLNAVTSSNYPAIGSRHRGMLYCDFIDRLIRIAREHPGDALPIPTRTFEFPNIL